jgi:purine-cytosine permease-like protein
LAAKQDLAPAQPQSDRLWTIETNGINPIPEEERHGRPFDMFWIWFASNIGVLGITYGAFLVTFYHLSLGQAALAGLLGTVLSFLLVGFISLAGKLGSAPTLILSRAAFGVRGNALTTAISYVSLVGWEIVLTALGALAAETVLARLGLKPSDPVLAISFVVVAGVTIVIALLGHATIVRIQQWFTWAFGAMTVVFFFLEIGRIDWHKVGTLPSGPLLAGVIGGISIVMAGFGIGWVNAAADYSRYLPRSSSSRGVVGWTTFGASLGPVFLIVFGILLAANDPNLATSANPIGALAAALPTWFLVPYLITAVGGLIAAVLLDLYSGGLNLLTLGVPLARYKSVAIDATLMVIGNIYVLFFARSFFDPFEGFLVTLGVLLAAWSAIFLVDMWLYRVRDGYDEVDLYRPSGRYGAFNLAGLAAFVVAAAVGLGLVTSTSPVFSWVGYLLKILPKSTAASLSNSSIGLLIAFVVGGVLYLVFSPLQRRAGVSPGPSVRPGFDAH